MNDWDMEKTSKYMERARQIADNLITEKAASIVRVRFGKEGEDTTEYEKRISYIDQELIVLRNIIRLIAAAYTIHEMFGKEGD